MRRQRAFRVGLLLVAISGVLWGLNSGNSILLGIFVGGATGLLNLVLLSRRLDTVAGMAARGRVRGPRTSIVSRMAIMLLVLLVLRHQLGTSGDLSFLGGFFVVEAVVLACS